MDRAAKQAEVTNLADKFQRSVALFVTDYKGMNVEQVTTVRKALSAQKDVEMKVVKNTLAVRAIESQPYSSALADHLIGTNAVIFSYSDPAAPAKALVKFAEEFEHMTIKVGVLKGQMMSEAMIKSLATLPSRDQLIAKVMGSLNAPAQNLAGVMAAIPRSILNVLNAIKEKKQTEAPAAAAAEAPAAPAPTA